MNNSFPKRGDLVDDHSLIAASRRAIADSLRLIRAAPAAGKGDIGPERKRPAEPRAYAPPVRIDGDSHKG